MDVRDVKVSERKQRYRGNEPGGSYSAGYLFMEFFHIILQDLTFLRCQFSTLMREAK